MNETNTAGLTSYQFERYTREEQRAVMKLFGSPVEISAKTHFNEQSPFGAKVLGYRFEDDFEMYADLSNIGFNMGRWTN